MKIGIAGYGYVGQAHEHILKNHYDIIVSDPAKGHYGDIRHADAIIICVSTPSKEISGHCDVTNVCDVIDDANMRRGFFSINALWKNKIAVLVGDYLLSKGLLMSLENEEYDLLQIVSKAVKEMSEGELLQIEKARKLDIEEDVYFEIIRQKTATLIAACCACGAVTAKQDKETVERMRKFGELIGIAFQMKDDLFDYYNEDVIGKPTGIDIKEQKMTLPLIYTLRNCNRKQKKFIIQTVKNHNTNSERVSKVLEIVKKSGGINYTIEKMKTYQEEALRLLKTFDDNESRKSLELLVNFVIERKK